MMALCIRKYCFHCHKLTLLIAKMRKIKCGKYVENAPQNGGEHISEVLNFKNIRGRWPQAPLVPPALDGR